jgi:hypothetical protein
MVRMMALASRSHSRSATCSKILIRRKLHAETANALPVSCHWDITYLCIPAPLPCTAISCLHLSSDNDLQAAMFFKRIPILCRRLYTEVNLVKFHRTERIHQVNTRCQRKTGFRGQGRMNGPISKTKTWSRLMSESGCRSLFSSYDPCMPTS